MIYLAQTWSEQEGWTTVAERKSVRNAVGALVSRGVPEARYGWLARNAPEADRRYPMHVHAEVKRDGRVVGRVVS